eukprot:9173578-Pyramimonas_sp.AAC.2
MRTTQNLFSTQRIGQPCIKTDTCCGSGGEGGGVPCFDGCVGTRRHQEGAARDEWRQRCPPEAAGHLRKRQHRPLVRPECHQREAGWKCEDRHHAVRIPNTHTHTHTHTLHTSEG